MLVRFAQAPLDGFRHRWMLPLIAALLGPALALGGLAHALAHSPFSAGALLAPLGLAVTLCGMLALVLRVRARFKDGIGEERRLDLGSDAASAAALALMSLGVFVWGALLLAADVAPARTVAGQIDEVVLDRGRGGDEVRLRLYGHPRIYKWECHFDCRPWEALAAVAEDNEALVRLAVLGDRIVGLRSGGRVVLREAAERARWTVRDSLIAGFGLLLTLCLGAASWAKARDALRL